MEYAPRRKLTREFKLEAVRQAALSEKPKAQLARELGVRVGQLRTWRLEFEKEAVTGIAKPDRSAAEDLEQLRRENAKLKLEIEILKKAAADSTDHCNTAWSLSAGAWNPKILLGRGQLLLRNAVALLFLEIQPPLAQLADAYAQLPRQLGLGLLAQRRLTNRF